MEYKVSFPFNNNEIINKHTVNVDFFKDVYEVYTVPFFMDIQYDDMNGEPEKYSRDAFKFLEQIHANGTKICVVFNNIFQEYDLVQIEKELKRFRHLIDWIDVPNDDFLQFNNFKIKNTVINVPSIDDIQNYSGYDLIYFHDDIIHNHDKFKAVKNKPFGCVVNFNECVSYCKLKKQHYKAIANHDFNFDLKYCPAFKMDFLELLLKRCAIPEDVTEYKYYSDVIDVFKLQGRKDRVIFENAVQIVNMLKNGTIPLHNQYIRNHLSKLDYIKYKLKTRNCTGNCKQCKFCDDLIKHRL